jgi:hypothetical protein
MFTSSQRLVVCTLIVLLSGCSERTSTRTVTEVQSRTYYPTNPGCTFDGKPGSTDDMSHMQNAKVISDECFMAPTPRVTTTTTETTRTLYMSNPGCTIDGVSGSSADTDRIVHAKVISDECYTAP